MGDFDAVEIGDFEECFEFCVSMSDWVRPIFGLGGDISCKNKKCFYVFEMLRCSNYYNFLIQTDPKSLFDGSTFLDPTKI